MGAETGYTAFLRDLPQDWQTAPVSAVAKVVGGGTPSRDVPAFWGGDIPWVTPGEVSGEGSAYLSKTRECISAVGLAGSGATLLPTGSLMLTTRATLGARAINAVPMTTNQGFKSLVFASGTDAPFYYYLADKLKLELKRRASGTTFLEVSGAELARIEVPVPPVGERRLIAEILDTLDSTIRQTEAIIEKLEQVKQGLLHDLLTRGIGDNGELRPPQSQAPHLYKDSPLGWIPRGWREAPLREIADLQVGFAFKSEWFRDSGSVRLLRGDNVGYGSPDWSATRFLTEELVAQFDEYSLDDGDVVVGMDRSFTKSGAKFSIISPADLPCLLVQRVGRFIATECELPFLRILTLWPDFQRRLIAQQKGMDIPHLSKSEILEPRVPVPAIEEQKEIAVRIRTIEARLAAEIQVAQKLRMEKSGLMDDLLTGRVRVTPLLA